LGACPKIGGGGEPNGFTVVGRNTRLLFDVAKSDSEEEHEDTPREWRALPIPRELHEAVASGALTAAGLMRQQAEQHIAHNKAFSRHLDTQFESKEAEQDDWNQVLAGRAGAEAAEALREQWSAASEQLASAVSAVNEWYSVSFTDYDDVDMYFDDEPRRECAAATFRLGAYAVVVSKVTDPREVDDPELADLDYRDWIDSTVLPYLEGRLGYTREGAKHAVTRAQHVSPETVLDGVDLDDAVQVKDELVSLGCKVQIVEGRLRSTRVGGVRAPIPESVRHEVWRRDQGRCVDCGSKEQLEFDHIIPLSRGGSNTVRNIELRCEPCNRKKGAII
jgi:HNH endonuclease